MNAGFNFFGRTNTVTAGPGPLALAGSVFQDGQTITRTNPGIAINTFGGGGAAATSGQNSTVPMANAVSNSPQTATAASPGGPVTKPISHRIPTSVKKFKDAVNGVTGGPNGRAPKPGADSTSKKGNAESTEQKGQRGQHEQKGQVGDIGSRLS